VGSWNVDNSVVLATVLKGGKVPVIPEGLKSVKDAEKVWMTILVLIWFEKAKSEE